MRSRLPLWVCVGVLALLGLGASPAVALVDPARDAPHLPRTCVSGGQVIPERPGACYLGPFVPARPTLVVWGDSHAWQQIPALRRAIGEREVNLVAFVMGACPPVHTGLRGREFRTASLCERSNVAALRFVRRLDSERRTLRVVVGGAWREYLTAQDRAAVGADAPASRHDAYFAGRAEMSRAGTPRLFRALGARGLDVHVVAQTAVVPDPPAPCLEGERPYACDMPRALALPREAETRQWLREVTAPLRHRRLVSVNSAFCDDYVCHGRADGVFTFYDDLHLSASRSRTLHRFWGATVRFGRQR